MDYIFDLIKASLYSGMFKLLCQQWLRNVMAKYISSPPFGAQVSQGLLLYFTKIKACTKVVN